MSTLKPTTLPLIIGHRGASSVAPENTLAAFSRSILDGAEGFEFDVRLARDGVPVVIHDESLDRTALRPGIIAELSSAELQQIDVGTSFNQRRPRAARPEYFAATVPTLEQVFELVKGSGQILYLEMKSELEEAAPLAAAVVQLVHDYRLIESVVVESFNLAAIIEVKRIAPQIRTAALFEPRLEQPASLLRKMKTIGLALDAGADQIALHRTLATRRVVAAALEANLPVVVWTVDNPIWIKRALSLGIAALITNDPAALIRERTRFTEI